MPAKLQSPTLALVPHLTARREQATSGLLLRSVMLCGTACLLCGCSLRGAPSYNIFGAFFPAWLLCSGIGIVGSVGLRRLFIVTGLEREMPFKPAVYVAFASMLALSIWLLLFRMN